MGRTLSAVSRKMVKMWSVLFFAVITTVRGESGGQLDMSRSLINRLSVVNMIVHLIIRSCTGFEITTTIVQIKSSHILPKNVKKNTVVK